MTCARLWGPCRKATPNYDSWTAAVNIASRESFTLGVGVGGQSSQCLASQSRRGAAEGCVCVGLNSPGKPGMDEHVINLLPVVEAGCVWL